MRVNISIREDVLKNLDDVARTFGISRSALISFLCSEGLKKYFADSGLFEKDIKKQSHKWDRQKVRLV